MNLSSLVKDVKKSQEKNKAIRALAADSLILYVKVSALHYLVQGKTFADLHKTTDDYYNFFIEVYDFLNERLVQLHEAPIHDLVEALKLSTITTQEKKNEYTTEEDSKELLAYFSHYKNKVTELKKLAGSANDFVTEDYCVQKLYFLNKEPWMLRARLSSNFIK